MGSCAEGALPAPASVRTETTYEGGAPGPEVLGPVCQPAVDTELGTIARVVST